MIKPLADRVLIEPKEAETKTASGIYLPALAKRHNQPLRAHNLGDSREYKNTKTSVGKPIDVFCIFFASNL